MSLLRQNSDNRFSQNFQTQLSRDFYFFNLQENISISHLTENIEEYVFEVLTFNQCLVRHSWISNKTENYKYSLYILIYYNIRATENQKYASKCIFPCLQGIRMLRSKREEQKTDVYIQSRVQKKNQMQEFTELRRKKKQDGSEKSKII